MTAAVLFDYGGTLDSDGRHWLDRFLAIYECFAPGVRSRDAIATAFYEAVRATERDPAVRSFGLRELVSSHVASQFAHLQLADAALERLIAQAFIASSEAYLDRNRDVLAQLRQHGLRLGIVSNFYGNLQAICEQFGLAPLVDVVLDSAVVGLRKPDPRFFLLALEALDTGASQTWFVGDSLDRDIRPAKALGLRTVWLCDDLEDLGSAAGLADTIIHKLPDLCDICVTSGDGGAL